MTDGSSGVAVNIEDPHHPEKKGNDARNLQCDRKCTVQLFPSVGLGLLFHYHIFCNRLHMAVYVFESFIMVADSCDVI